MYVKLRRKIINEENVADLWLIFAVNEGTVWITYIWMFFFFFEKKNLFLFSSIYLFVFFSQILINLHLTTSIFVFFQWRQLLVECSLHQRKAGPGSWTCTCPGVQVFSKIKYIIQNKDCTFMWPFRPYSQLLAQLALSHPLSSANWGKNISYIYL